MGMVDHRFDIVDRATFRSGMSRLGASVNVVTTRSGSERYGFTASAVCSVSDTPATLLVCINRASSCFHAFGNTRHFCVNTLMPGQEDISNLFGGRTPSEDRFTLGEWTEGLTGVPVLANASVIFRCPITPTSTSSAKTGVETAMPTASAAASSVFPSGGKAGFLMVGCRCGLLALRSRNRR